MDEYFFLSESTKAALQLLSQVGVMVLESIVVDELCEFNGRQNLANSPINITVTSLVRTTSVDPIAKHRFVCC